MKNIFTLILFSLSFISLGQATGSISGKIKTGSLISEPIKVVLQNTSFETSADSLGSFEIKNIHVGNYKLQVFSLGFDDYKQSIVIADGENTLVNITLTSHNKMLNEVVVTGVSRATLIRENPMSISSISAKNIEKAQESNIIDVLVKNAPGLNAVKTGPNISKPFIRGLGYNRVLTLYDGIRQEGQQWGDEHGIEVDSYNMERAEVIKGPSSLMFGSDAIAGVVSLFPYIPKDTNGKIEGKFLTEYQSNNDLIGNGLRLGYSKNNWLFATRASIKAAGNYQNKIDGRVYNTSFNEKNFSALVGRKTEKGYSHFNFTLYDNIQGIPDGTRDSISRKFTRQIYEGANDDVKNRTIVSQDELNSYKISPLHQHIEHYRIYSKNHYKINEGIIDFLLGWQQNVRREYNHPTAIDQAGLYVRLNTLNYGVTYGFPAFKSIETSVGINGMLQNNKSLDATNFPIPDYDLYDGGAYWFAKWKSDRWTASGGLRYDIRKVKFDDFYVGKNPVTGFDKHITSGDLSNATLQFPKYDKKFEGVSGSLGTTFRASENISLKANIGRGYRCPNITEIASNGLDPGAHIIYMGNRNFNPEFSLQEDIGASVRYDDISGELSFFNNNIQNYINLALVVDANGNPITDAQGNKTYQYLQTSAQLYGMEAWFSLHPKKLPGFSFDNSFSLIYGFNKDPKFENKGLNGEYLPLIPPMKILSNVSQKISPKSGMFSAITPRLEMEINGAQNRFLQLNNTETFTPAYSLFNASVAFEISLPKKQELQLFFQMNNLFDVAYQSNLSRLKYFEYYTHSTNGASGIYGMGRNACIKLIYSF